MGVNRQSLIDKAAAESGLSRSDTAAVFELMFEEISNALVAGQYVKLAGFCTFAPKSSPQRPARNPKTGEPVMIPAHTRIQFRPSNHLKAVVQGRNYAP